MANWKPVVGYENLYEVSDEGEIRRFGRTGSRGQQIPPKLIHGSVNPPTGLHCLILTKNKKSRMHMRHRVVAEAFVPNPNNFKFVYHKDADRDNNYADNLEWRERAERDHKTGEQSQSYRHGMSKTRLFHIWANMRSRCKNPKNVGFKRYGGRGISVCKEWDESFEVFHTWANASGYTDLLTIERIDVNGNYCPENCTWIPGPEQSRNKTNNIVLHYNGESKRLLEWCELFGYNPAVIRNRIKLGWDVERALEQPIRKSPKRNDAV